MGEIINVTAVEKDLPEPLTETEESGFRTGSYLEDQPAIEHVADDETVQFVVTNRKQGIAIRSDTTRHVVPDRGYQTVVVVTDRRLVALVGTNEGDERFTLPLSEITDVATKAGPRTGQLTIDRVDGPTWKIQTEASGLGGVASHLRNSSEASLGGKVRTTKRSIRSLFDSTVDTAKSFRNDRVAELVPTIGNSPHGRAGPAEAPSPTDSPGPGDGTGQQSDCPDTETTIDEILHALAKTDWRARGAKSESPFDLLAEREDELVGVVVHCPDDGRIDRSTIKRCEAITGAAGTDTVMLATTGTVRDTDARLAADLGVRLRNVATLSDATDPPTIEAVTEMVTTVLTDSGWSVRAETSGPFDLLAESGGELMGIVVHGPEDGTVRSSIEHCDVVTGAAGTDTVMLATTGTVRDSDERLADDLGVRLVESDSLGQRHVTEIEHE